MLINSSLNIEMGTLVLTFSEQVSSEKATVSIPRALLKCTNLLIVGADTSAVKTVGLSPVVTLMASLLKFFNVSSKAPSAYVRKQLDHAAWISLTFMRLRSDISDANCEYGEVRDSVQYATSQSEVDRRVSGSCLKSEECSIN